MAGAREEVDITNENYDFVKQYIKNTYSIEERIITLCDLMCTTKTVTIEKRLIDILLRHGASPNTQYHTEEIFKLKNYFDNILNDNVYNLFPEIKNNL